MDSVTLSSPPPPSCETRREQMDKLAGGGERHQINPNAFSRRRGNRVLCPFPETRRDGRCAAEFRRQTRKRELDLCVGWVMTYPAAAGGAGAIAAARRGARAATRARARAAGLSFFPGGGSPGGAAAAAAVLVVVFVVHALHFGLLFTIVRHRGKLGTVFGDCGRVGLCRRGLRRCA
jgi:hypothetical protein